MVSVTGGVYLQLGTPDMSFVQSACMHSTLAVSCVVTMPYDAFTDGVENMFVPLGPRAVWAAQRSDCGRKLVAKIYWSRHLCSPAEDRLREVSVVDKIPRRPTIWTGGFRVFRVERIFAARA